MSKSLADGGTFSSYTLALVHHAHTLARGLQWPTALPTDSRSPTTRKETEALIEQAAKNNPELAKQLEKQLALLEEGTE